MAKIPIDLSKGTLKKIETPKDNLIIGIDLGTTNSLVAYMQDGQPVVVQDHSGSNTLVPSVVYFENDRQVVVGQEALEKLISAPQNTIFSVKRLMGKSYQDVEAFKKFFSYEVIENSVEDSLVKVRIADKFYTPIELSAKILAYLKNRIEKSLDATISKAVITVPAYFNDAQRQATRDAGKLAGLDVLRIVNEPTAASLAYGIGIKGDESIYMFTLLIVSFLTFFKTHLPSCKTFFSLGSISFLLLLLLISSLGSITDLTRLLLKFLHAQRHEMTPMGFEAISLLVGIHNIRHDHILLILLNGVNGVVTPVINVISHHSGETVFRVFCDPCLRLGVLLADVGDEEGFFSSHFVSHYVEHIRLSHDSCQPPRALFFTFFVNPSVSGTYEDFLVAFLGFLAAFLGFSDDFNSASLRD